MHPLAIAYKRLVGARIRRGTRQPRNTLHQGSVAKQKSVRTGVHGLVLRAMFARTRTTRVLQGLSRRVTRLSSSLLLLRLLCVGQLLNALRLLVSGSQRRLSFECRGFGMSFSDTCLTMLVQIACSTISA